MNWRGKIRNGEMPEQVCTSTNCNCFSGTFLTQLTRRNQPACCSSFVFSEIIQRWIHLKLSLFNVYQQKDLLTKWCPMFINGKCSHPSCDKTPSSVWHVHALNTFDKNRESTPHPPFPTLPASRKNVEQPTPVSWILWKISKLFSQQLKVQGQQLLYILW